MFFRRPRLTADFHADSDEGQPNNNTTGANISSNSSDTPPGDEVTNTGFDETSWILAIG